MWGSLLEVEPSAILINFALPYFTYIFKSSYVCFVKKKFLQHLEYLHLCFTNEIKYLGIILDGR
jgi:hypothetical protein